MGPEDPLGLPWLLPGVTISVIASLVVSGPVGRSLRVSRLVAWVMVLSFGIIVATTLTPQWEALAFGAQGASTCDLSRVGLAPLDELLTINETSLNILLFIPLGASIAFIPWSWRMVLAVVAAVALPLAIETTQLLLPVLDRGCQSADVVDNLTGLVIGLAIGVVARQFRSGGAV